MKRLLAHVLFAIALGVVSSLRAHAGGTNADSFIQGLFASFSWTPHEMRDPLDGNSRDEFLEPGLLALWNRYAQVNTGPGISISLCDCQEGPVSGLRIRVVEESSNSANVEARFNAGGDSRVLRYLLQKGDSSGWLIADIQSWIDPAHPWSFRRGLAVAAESEAGHFDPGASVGRWAGADCRRDWTDWTWDGQSVRFISPTGGVDVERWVATLPSGFATETTSGTNTRPGVRWEYRFNSHEVQISNKSTGRSFTLKPCATSGDAALALVPRKP